MKTFQNTVSKTALFSVNGYKRQCTDGLYSTDDPKEIEFLENNQNFVEYDPSMERGALPEDVKELQKELEEVRAANDVLVQENEVLAGKVLELEKAVKETDLGKDPVSVVEEDAE